MGKGGGKGKGPGAPPPQALHPKAGCAPKAAARKQLKPEELEALRKADEEKMSARQALAREATLDNKGLDPEELAAAKAAKAATLIKCELCGFSVPPEDMQRHSTGHENCILKNWLFLGSKDNVNVRTMFRRRITHILNVADHLHKSDDDTTVVNLQSFKDDLADMKAEKSGTADAELLKYTVRSFNWQDDSDWVSNRLSLDDPGEDPSFSLRAATRWIKEMKDAGKNVLVHCSMGISRSSSTIIAYLIEYEGFTLKRAWDHCKECRSIIRPNDGLIKKLGELEVMLKRATSPTMTAEEVDAEERRAGKLLHIHGTFNEYEKDRPTVPRKPRWFIFCLLVCLGAFCLKFPTARRWPRRTILSTSLNAKPACGTFSASPAERGKHGLRSEKAASPLPNLLQHPITILVLLLPIAIAIVRHGGLS